MTYSTVLFDLDGTLTDSATGINNSVFHAVAALGMPAPDPNQVKAFVGPPLREVFTAIGVDACDLDAAVRHYRAYYSDRGLLENEVYPGIKSLLSELEQRNIRMAVATSKPVVYAERILAHFGLTHYFDTIAGAELDGTRSVKHEVIEFALAQLGIQAGPGVVMVGDRSHDVLGARRAGLPFIGVTWGYATLDELTTAGALWLAHDPAELLGLITTPITTGPSGTT